MTPQFVALFPVVTQELSLMAQLMEVLLCIPRSCNMSVILGLS